jgi:hypothetical protein
VQVKEVETKKCGTVFQSSICVKKIGHFGKHFDGAGTSWTDAGARVKEEAEAARIQKEAKQ